MDSKPIVVLGDLDGPAGNSFAILAACRLAGRRAGWSKEQIETFLDEAMSDDYHFMRAVISKHFRVAHTHVTYKLEE